jgi:hypothetical protein
LFDNNLKKGSKPMKNKVLHTMLFLVCGMVVLHAQQFREHPEDISRNKGKAILLHITGGAHLPAADMAKRFGPDASAGGRLEFITAKNLIFGAEGYYLFGSKVKEEPVDILQTADGYIIGNDRSPASLFLLERGYYLGLHIGKLFPVGKGRSGIRATVGAGMLRHKILLQDDTRTINQITGDYAKGYDRLTGGFALNEFVGWQYVGKNRRINFVYGFEFNQGFTNTLRDWDFAEARKLDAKRLDLRFGIRAAWILPFYFTKSEEIYY